MSTEPHEGAVESEKPYAHKVEAMAGYGLSPADIALVLAIDETEVRSVYQREIETGSVKTNLRVAESLFRKATSDGSQSVAAAIFWAKTRMGWREKGEPTTTEVTEVVIRHFAVEWEAAPDRPGQLNRAPANTQSIDH